MKDRDYIERIIKYANKITKYMSSVQSFSEFAINEEKIDAVILNLEQIGETAKKLSIEAKENYKEINWKNIIGLRNMISHEYEGIRLEIIYQITTESVRELLDLLRQKTMQ